MGQYKGIELDERLTGLIPAMGGVEEYRESLQKLQGVWDNLTLLGQLSGTGTDMTETRQEFGRLTGSLLNNLGIETLRKRVSEMQFKAQVVVDIMIRNLFERTADIGFLATDEDLREYCSAGTNADSPPDSADDRGAGIRERFREYVRKYSVYSNIILLDCDGRVLVQLDEANPVSHSQDPLIGATLATEAEYLESFGPTDLAPRERQALIYSYRVTDPESAEPLGILCLVFRFDNETEGIFANLQGGRDDWCVLLLLDGEGRVIASSEAWQVPVGAVLELVLDQDYGRVRFAGREYLAVTRPTTGYQGFKGLGWYGHVMVPLEHAFNQGDDSRSLEQVTPEILQAVMANPALFSEALRRIPPQAEMIQQELNRSVWNGNVNQGSGRRTLNPAFSKVLLWEISNTGLKTKEVFAQSIANLHETVVSAILQDSRFLAALAIDIMDRNLYERANDCRWWALTTAFRRMLAAPRLSDEDSRLMSAVLAHINSLYTVYENLLVFDRKGKVVAVSNPAFQELVGSVLNEEWVRRTLALADSQCYAVSDFASTPLYRGRPTYTYAAAIRAPNGEKVVGGIGIVFDSEPQFAAMLQDALPRDGQDAVAAGAFGVLVDRSRRVVASTTAHFAPGAVLPLEAKFCDLASGEGASWVVEHGGTYYALGAKMSAGYREYKGEGDVYRNEIVAMIWVPLGEASDETGRKTGPDREPPPRLELQSVRGEEPGQTTEIATFHVGRRWFGLRSREVVEAIDALGLTPLPGAGPHVKGYLMYRNRTIMVVDLCALVAGNGSGRVVQSDESQVVVLRLNEDNEYLGLLVDGLGEIPELPNSRIEKLSTMFTGEGLLGDSIVKPENGSGRELLIVLSAEAIRNRLLTSGQKLKHGLAKEQPVAAEQKPRN